ncbi:hypothetical protein AOLI_G00303830 [Acnodon oligacanthus]
MIKRFGDLSPACSTEPYTKLHHIENSLTLPLSHFINTSTIDEDLQRFNRLHEVLSQPNARVTIRVAPMERRATAVRRALRRTCECAAALRETPARRERARAAGLNHLARTAGFAEISQEGLCHAGKENKQKNDREEKQRERAGEAAACPRTVRADVQHRERERERERESGGGFGKTSAARAESR